MTKFLVKAKINTYASSGEGGEKILPDGSKEFEFGERELKYRDRYFGFNSFISEEIVWENKKMVWGMNYYGEIISEIISAKDIYQFLQEALKRVSEDKPFRGPDNLKKAEFGYINKTEGTVEKFQGEEIIFLQRAASIQIKLSRWINKKKIRFLYSIFKKMKGEGAKNFLLLHTPRKFFAPELSVFGKFLVSSCPPPAAAGRETRRLAGKKFFGGLGARKFFGRSLLEF